MENRVCTGVVARSVRAGSQGHDSLVVENPGDPSVLAGWSREEGGRQRS